MEAYISVKNNSNSSKHEFLGIYKAVPEVINNKYYYQSTFDNGKHGIWWCGLEWQIGNMSLVVLVVA